MGVEVIGTGGTERVLSDIRVTDAGGTDRAIAEGRVIGPDGVDRVFFSIFGVSVSPAAISARWNSASTITITTGVVTASAEGAVGTVTYSWAFLSGDAGFTINSPASASTTFSHDAAAEEIFTAVFRCTVTDSGGHSGTVDVTVTVLNTYRSLL